jgi:hypothetical protein
MSHILFPREAADKCMEARNAYAEARKERVGEFLYSGYTGHYDNSGYGGCGALRLHCLAAEQATRSAVALSHSPQLRCSLSRLFPRTCEQLASGLFRWIRYLQRFS